MTSLFVGDPPQQKPFLSNVEAWEKQRQFTGQYWEKVSEIILISKSPAFIFFFKKSFHISVNGGGEQVTKGLINIQFSR